MTTLETDKQDAVVVRECQRRDFRTDVHLEHDLEVVQEPNRDARASAQQERCVGIDDHVVRVFGRRRLDQQSAVNVVEQQRAREA